MKTSILTIMKARQTLVILSLFISNTVAFAGSSGYSNVASATTPTNNPPSGFTIPTAHPRLWWTPARINQAKTWFATHPFSRGGSADWPMKAAFLYLLTGNASEARAAIDWAVAYTLPQNELNGVSSDNARWNGENVIAVYDWCHDQMTATERQTIINRWNGYLTTLKAKSWGGIGMEGNNYYWGYLRNELEWGIVTHGENAQAQTFLDHALTARWQNSFLPFAAGASKGGVPADGSQYGRYTYWYSLLPFVSLTQFGRSIYEETPYFKESVYYLIYATTPAPTTLRGSSTQAYEVFPYQDDEFWRYGGSAQGNYDGDFMRTAANLWAGQPVGQYARRWLNMVNPANSPWVSAVDNGSATREFTALPLDYYSPGIRYLYARNQWGPQATSAQFQLGQAEPQDGHQHLDAGSFQLWRNGRWLSRETAGYSEQIAGFAGQGTVENRATLGHNGIVFSGNFKGLGIANAYVDGFPQTLRLESRPAYAYAAVDLSKAYRASGSTHTTGGGAPRDDNPYVKSAIREFVFVRALETLVVLDRLESRVATGWDSTPAANVVKTFVLHFEQSPTVQGANSVLGVNGNQALQVTTLVPSAPTYRVVNEGGAIGQYRLEVDTSGSAQTHFLHVLQARDATAANVSATLNETATTYTVTLQHPTAGNATVTFNKGMTSTGGSVNGAALTGGVQSIQVTDNGPVWGP